MTGVRGCWQHPSQGDAELSKAAHTTRFSQLYQVKVFPVENKFDLKDKDDDKNI